MKSTTAVTSQVTNGTSKARTANGFDALLVGDMVRGVANGYGTNVYFWSSSSSSSSNARFRSSGNNHIEVNRNNGTKYQMFSVRCKKN
jgi:uncharacterized protein (TIGR02145 family)